MQTQLEIDAIKERKIETIKNVFGVDNEYGEDDAKKGGEDIGSFSDHTNNYFDTTTGGDKEDQDQRKKQLLYKSNVNQTRYSEGNGYGVDVFPDTELNVGQIKFVYN